MTPTAQLIAALQAGHCPTADELHDLCTAIHASQVDCDAPELLWLTTSFEDMADGITRALRCVGRGVEYK